MANPTNVASMVPAQLTPGYPYAEPYYLVDVYGNPYAVGNPQPMILPGVSQIAPTDGSKATYSASITGLIPAASCTDLVSLIGSATKTVRVTHIEITGQTTAVTARSVEVQLLKRSTASTTSGVSTGSPTAVPHDSNDAASTAVMKGWTTCNTSLGALVGTALRNRAYNLNLITDTATDFPPQESISWDFGNRPGQAIVLHGVAEQIAINLNGGSMPAGSVYDIAIEWSEE